MHTVTITSVVALHNLFWMSVMVRGLKALRGKQQQLSGAKLVARVMLAITGGTLLADTVAFFTHYFLDNYLSEHGILGLVVREFILHHKLPKFQQQTFIQNGWRESLFTSSMMVTAMAAGLCRMQNAFSAIFWGSFGFWGGQISGIHKAAHVAKPAWPYALGQRIRLIIDRRHHALHHATLTSNFSLCTGHFEAMLERVRGVECLEAGLYLLLGAVPRNSRLGLREEAQERRLAQRLQHLKWIIWYKFFNEFTTGAELGLHFMNWGYGAADAGVPLPPGAERVLGKDGRLRVVNEASLQLYLHLLQGVALEGQDVAEVSSGRGGFLACLAGSGQVRSCIGIDACAAAVDTCNRTYADIPNLRFQHGDAMAPLGFRAHVVVNVEASHCYPSREAFFRRVHEALEPGGRLLFADFVAKAEVAECVGWLTAEGRFCVEVQEDITEAVLRAMARTNSAKLQLIRERFPRMVRGLLERFAATEGSVSRGDTTDGWRDSVYLHLRARKL